MQRVIAIRAPAQAQAAEPRVNPEVGACRKAFLLRVEAATTLVRGAPMLTTPASGLLDLRGRG